MTGNFHIVVCLKVVPRPEEVRVDPATNTLDRAKAKNLINPPDMNALEAALALKERHGGRVSVLSMGPPFAVEYLNVALAMGADAAYLLSDRAFGGADTLATSYTLAQGIRKIGPADLIICGEESSDGATAQVPAGIAEWMDAAQVTYATDLEISSGGGFVIAKREIKGGYQKIKAKLPAIISVKGGINEPRFFDVEKRRALPAASVTVWSVKDLSCDPNSIGSAGSPTTVAGLRQVATGERLREMIKGDPAEAAKKLAEKILPLLTS